MLNLKPGQLKDTIEMLTGIVVIVSLVFVGIEVRQNTAAIKMQAYQTSIDKLDHRSYLLASDKELHRIDSLAQTARDELTEAEWSRYTLFTLPHLAVWEFIYDASTKGNIDWHQWQGFERYFLMHYCMPNSPTRLVYHENITIWSDPFLEHIAEVEKDSC